MSIVWNDVIIYEQPINEHVRVCLRLEQLFEQVEFYLQGSAVWDCQTCLNGILAIIDLLERQDLKTKFLKDFSRYFLQLETMEQIPGINKAKLHLIIQDLNQLLHKLKHMDGKITAELRENEFLTHLRQQYAAGSISSLNSPVYHYWLQQSADKCYRLLQRWYTQFETIQSAIQLFLSLTRGSIVPGLKVAQDGFYQAALDAQQPYQLIRVILPHHAAVCPKISVGRHRLSIRFMIPYLHENSMQVRESIDFKLACCVF